MTDSPSSPTRIVKAEQFRDGIKNGEIEIVGYTKHGPTMLMGFDPMADIEPKDVLKTRVWILNAKDFQIVRTHDREMKLAGKWFVVKTIPHVKSH